MQEKFQYGNVMEIPKLEKIVINIGVGDAVGNAKALEDRTSDGSPKRDTICIVSLFLCFTTYEENRCTAKSSSRGAYTVKCLNGPAENASASSGVSGVR